MDVLIKYRNLGKDSWETLLLPLAKYLDHGEPLDVKEGLPRFNHAIEYLEGRGISADKVQNTKIVLEDPSKKFKTEITETFWNSVTNRAIEREDWELGKPVYWEMIQEVRHQENLTITEFIRFGRNNDVLTILFHSQIETLEDGTEKEIRIFPLARVSG